MRATVGALVDPSGPIGEVASPSEVYKTRLGLPTQSPHVARARLEAPPQIEQALAPVRFVALADAVDVPKDRVRQVSAFVDEVWAPVYRRTESTDLAAIVLASQDQVGWEVRQRESQASRDARRARLNAEQFAEVLQTAQIQPSDSFYVGYAESIPGNDPVIVDGQVLRAPDGTIVRGGTMIRGRQHHRQVTKNMAFWDAGFVAQREAALAEEASRPVRNVQRAMAAVAGESLPMWRPVGINPRRDRRSGV